jgi:hypothetical protein
MPQEEVELAWKEWEDKDKKRELPSQPQVPSLRMQLMNANGQLVEQLVLSNLNPKP